MTARNFTFSNIQNIYYKSLDSNLNPDVTTIITAGVGGGINHGKMKTQANEIELDANTINIGRNSDSITRVKGIFYAEQIFSDDGRIDVSNAILAQF